MTPASRSSRRLEEIAARYDPSNPSEQFDYHLKRLQTQTITPWLRGARVLELGCATGELTSLLAPLSDTYDVVEGSQHNVDVASRRVPGANFVLSMWEDYEPTEHYSDIVLCNALEHVPDPVGLLRRVATWLLPEGRVHVAVPNGLSLHRLVGVEMGLQPDPLTLTEGDTDQGHFRNYTVDTLLADLRDGGLDPVHWEGIFLKVLSNRQMLAWDWELIQALHRVARKLPEHAAELYAVAVARP
jgi:2-polyprenyl-3-methyl-5-hydroxy-6-metoxy-1,4-benzoquinol methylase